MLLAKRARAARLDRSSTSCSVVASAAGPRRCHRTNCCSAWKRPNRSRRGVMPRPRRPMRRLVQSCGPAPQEQRIAAGASAAGRDTCRHRRSRLPLLPARAAPGRRGTWASDWTSSRLSSGSSSCAARSSLPGLRDHDAGRGAGAADRGRAADRSHRGADAAKYGDHLPLYRQAQIYACQGLDLDRSTLADWVGHAAFLLRPVHERLLAP